MRYMDRLNAFREKIAILERGLDARAVEIMKSNAPMSMAQARVKAWEESPELVSEYEKSR